MDVSGMLAKAGEHLTAARSFGPVIERDDCLVIPAALVIGGGGGGGDEGPRGDGTERGTSGGMGQLSVSWPLGAYVVQGDRVRWIPAIDATRVALAVLALAKLVLAHRRLRHRHRHG